MKLCLAAILCGSLSSCTPAASPSAAEIAGYTAAQVSCVEQADAQPAADACRAATRAPFCAKYPSMCSADGGR
jgi:hypothetical protein